jgi:hypothetical protein
MVCSVEVGELKMLRGLLFGQDRDAIGFTCWFAVAVRPGFGLHEGGGCSRYPYVHSIGRK